MSEITIEPGQTAVVRRGYWGKYICVQVSKVTPKQIKASGEWSSRDHTYQRDDVVFSGAKTAADLLKERLTSSEALCSEECQKANVRKNERAAKLIADANATNQSSTGTVK
jgi:hypothetical protein